VVEWLVLTVKESILATIRGDTARWPEVVPEVQYFCNTTVTPGMVQHVSLSSSRGRTRLFVVRTQRRLCVIHLRGR
jgi:hypothetical protein